MSPLVERAREGTLSASETLAALQTASEDDVSSIALIYSLYAIQEGRVDLVLHPEAVASTGANIVFELSLTANSAQLFGFVTAIALCEAEGDPWRSYDQRISIVRARSDTIGIDGSQIASVANWWWRDGRRHLYEVP